MCILLVFIKPLIVLRCHLDLVEYEDSINKSNTYLYIYIYDI